MNIDAFTNWNSFLRLGHDARLLQPVSFRSDAKGKNVVLSNYGDDRWDFYPYIPLDNLKSAEKLINWVILMPDGHLLTSPKHQRLLDSSKAFIWSLFLSPLDGKTRPTLSTIISKVELLRPLLRWMIGRGFSQFNQLDGHTMDYVSAAKCSLIANNEVSGIVHNARLVLLEMLYAQRAKLEDAISLHPWPHETAMSLSGNRRSWEHRSASTEPIPEDVTCKIADVSIDYIKNRSVKILNGLHLAENAQRKAISYAKNTQCRYRSDAAKEAGYSGGAEMKLERRLLRTSCYIVIGIFSGLRESELASLEVNCISREPSHDGTTEIIWLHGTIHKYGTRPKRWIVPEIVASAIEVLQQLTNRLRLTLKSDLLRLKKQRDSTKKESTNEALHKQIHIAERQKNKLFLTSLTKYENRVCVISGSGTGLELKKFCTIHGIMSAQKVPYALHSAQFRRTYARFVARSELGDLIALKEHFGHSSLDMTAYYCADSIGEFESDVELLDLIVEEMSSRQEEIIRSYVSTDAPLANGEWLKSWRNEIRTAKNKEELIKRYAGTLTLNGTGHSWCAGNSKGLGCGGLCIFEAQLCVTCHYGIIGPEHLPVWRGIRDQQLEVLELDDVGPGGKDRAQQILGIAENVLSRLNGSTDL